MLFCAICVYTVQELLLWLVLGLRYLPPPLKDHLLASLFCFLLSFMASSFRSSHGFLPSLLAFLHFTLLSLRPSFSRLPPSHL